MYVLKAQNKHIMMNKMRFLKIISISYFLFLSISWIVFLERYNPYSRPSSYFVLLSLLSGLILIQILLSPKKISLKYKLLIFLEIFLLSFSFTFSQELLYKTVLGRDPWHHWTLTEIILLNGHIPTYLEIPTIGTPMAYVKMPNFHLLVGSYMLLSEISYKWGSYVITGLGTLILLMNIIYLLTKKIFKDERISTLSTLLLAISDNVLNQTGKNLVPQTIGVAIAFLILYLSVKRKFLFNSKGKLIMFILMIGLLFTYTISYFFILIQLSILLLTTIIFAHKISTKYIKEYALLLTISATLAFLTWAYFSKYYFDIFVDKLYRLLFIHRFESLEEHVYKVGIPLTKVLLARGGMLLFFSIVGITIFLILIKFYKEFLKLTLAIISGVFICCGIIGPFTPTLSEISQRFWYYGEVLGSIFIGYIIFRMWNYKGIKILVVVLVTLLTWLMFVSSVANDDNPLVNEYTLRTGWYDSEIASAKFVLWNSNKRITSDLDFSINLIYLMTNLAKATQLIDVPLSTFNNFQDAINDRDNIFIVRIELVKDRCFVLGGRWNQKLFTPFGDEITKLIKDIFVYRNVIYNNQNVLMGVKS